VKERPNSIVPDADIDVLVQTEAVKRGDKRAAYFPGRSEADLPHGVIAINISDGVESGVAVFNSGADMIAYTADVRHKGVRAANAEWLGYDSDYKGDDGLVVSVKRGGGVVHDECVQAHCAEERRTALAKEWPDDEVIVTTGKDALLARVARYSEADASVFSEAIETVRSL